MIPVYTSVRVKRDPEASETEVGKVIAYDEKAGTLTVRIDDTDDKPGDDVTVAADQVEVLR